MSPKQQEPIEMEKELTDTELMEAALNLLLKFRYRQTILADHQEAIEAALEARVNAMDDKADGEYMPINRVVLPEPSTEAEYEAGMAALDALLDLDPAPGTPEYDKLDLLAMRLEQYEVKMMAEQKFCREERPTSREWADTIYALDEAVAVWEAANPEPEDNRKETVICRVEGKYVPFNRTVLPASITEIRMYWPCGVELCEKLNNGETL